jgi:ribosomal protein S18 acetylase RimI-like enzyme
MTSFVSFAKDCFNECQVTQSSYQVSCESALNNENLKKVVQAVIRIQKSIDWNRVDLNIAMRRLELSDNPKVFVHDPSSGEIHGYAIVVPKEIERENLWYISQIAVDRKFQRGGIGRAIMHKIFEEAMEHGIRDITLDTDGEDEKLMKFYRSFRSQSIQVFEGCGEGKLKSSTINISYHLSLSMK